MDFDFCVLMSVYEKDNENYLNEALESLLSQTVKANEVIMIADGPLKDGQISIINKFKKILNIRIINLDENKGLAHALKIGVESSNYEWIARMDSDDICYPERFALQTEYLKLNPSIDIVGGNITEFQIKGKTISKRLVKENHEKIIEFSKFFSPMNHVTVMFRKSAVLNAGNYNQKYTMMEDYPLWMAMISNGAQFHNIQRPLVDVRVEGLSSRRKGLKYAKTEANMLIDFYKKKYIKLHHLIINLTIRFPIRTIASPMIKYAYMLTRGKSKFNN
ncbi:glycosyltransferase [Vibrio sp. NTOU-M3]|uniref:glycosyltransferase n=1 Tax=Vibrio sp. NTOU-M3 TaxID=3234954 RepID=UPI00349F2218